MSENLIVISLFNHSVTLYAVLMGLAFISCVALTAFFAKSHGLKAWQGVLYCMLALVLGLFLGRAIYCGVRYEWIFYDAVGYYVGLMPFFSTNNGSANVIGILLGALLAAAFCRLFTRRRAGDYLDCAALPGLFLFTIARLAEPFSGQGAGMLLTLPQLCFSPLAIENDWGEWTLSVCFVEAVLAAIVLIIVCFFAPKCKKSGTLAMLSMALLSASQIMPESLRLDDVLKIFIFARVTQIGYVVLLMGVLAFALARGKKRGLPGKNVALEIALMLLGIMICIGMEFALDKSNYSHLLVYGIMILTLIGMAILACRRAWKEDQFRNTVTA